MVLSEEPRTKCCKQCAFRKNDPQWLRACHEIPYQKMKFKDGRDTFYCIHTEDKLGRNQKCAGYQALYGRHIDAKKAAA